MRSQILEVKHETPVPIVVVLNKTDLIDASVSPDGADPSSLDQSQFLCQEMVESLVTCDWDHGFVAASAKESVNIVEVLYTNIIQFLF